MHHSSPCTYDKKAKPRTLEVGSMALMRVPGLTGKLDESWEGPYEVVDKISPVNYQLAIPGRAGRSQVVHVNMLRPWHTPDARVLRLIVADEDEEETTPTETQLNYLEPDQKQELEELLSLFEDVITPVPGSVSLLQHAIIRHH